MTNSRSKVNTLSKIVSPSPTVKYTYSDRYSCTELLASPRNDTGKELQQVPSHVSANNGKGTKMYKCYFHTLANLFVYAEFIWAKLSSNPSLVSQKILVTPAFLSKLSTSLKSPPQIRERLERQACLRRSSQECFL